MIPEEIKNKIVDAADIVDVIGEFIDIKPHGKNHKGICPFCEKKDFTVTPSKDIYKCFKCGHGGKGAVSFLMESQNMEFVPALKWLADRYSIVWEDRPKRKKPSPIKDTFRDAQLKASGLAEEDQRFDVYMDETTTKQINRYESASIDKYDNVVPGDDMVMHYVTLDGTFTSYTPDGKGKERKLTRVRWQVPENHLDKHGNPIKYKSPFKSGSHLWITNKVQKHFKHKSVIPRLFIQEGEKKADKATKHGLVSVGIMGINNFSMADAMPHDFQRILNTCQVKEVVFVLDSDFNELSHSTQKGIESRPTQFLAAVRKFKNYFYAFQAQGIKVKTFLAYVKPNKPNIKGIDDLLVLLRGDEQYLVKDFDQAMLKLDGQGDHVDCIDITGFSEHQLRQIFYLHTKEAFLDFHKDTLKKREVFTYKNIKWKYDQEKDDFVLDQPLLPDEEYWNDDSYITQSGRYVKKFSFSYGNAYHFLRNRGFGRFQIPNNSRYRFVQLQKNVLREVETYQMKDFVINFTENIGEHDVLEMLYRGAKMYLGPDSLSNLKFIQTEFHKSSSGVQYLYFKNTYWRITADGVQEKPLAELDRAVWADNIIDFNAHKSDFLLSPFVIDQNKLDSIPAEHKKIMMKHYDCVAVDISPEAEKNDFFRFLFNTSNFFWNEKLKNEKNPFAILKGDSLETEVDNQMEVTQHLLSKITAVGYMLHHFRDSSILKAVVAMDGKLSEVGQSNGRTGKSILGDALEKMLPTVTIPGKKNRLTEDDFLFAKVDERTRMVFVDDARPNLDFEFFFPMITGKLDVNRKGKDAFSLSGNEVPKLFITTNHALNGEGSSFKDRQHLIAFSDWYNDKHKPVDDFGQLFFDEWDHDQWNRFYNLMAECLVLYFQYGLIKAPEKRLEARRIRQFIGEALLDWAELYYDSDGPNINREQTRKDVFSNFMNAYPKQSKYIDTIKFKRKLKAFCSYKNLVFNPGYPGKSSSLYGGDIKKGSQEYFIIGDNHFDASNAKNPMHDD